MKDVQPGAPLLDPRLTTTDAIKQVVRNLENSVLFIQGPPGAGKTYTGSHVVVDLLKAGKRIGVTSNSHHAIDNLLAAVESRAQAEGVAFKGLKKSSEGDGTEFTGRCIRSIEDKKDFLHAWGPGIDLTAGTAWLFADETFTEACTLAVPVTLSSIICWMARPPLRLTVGCFWRKPGGCIRTFAHSFLMRCTKASCRRHQEPSGRCCDWMASARRYRAAD